MVYTESHILWTIHWSSLSTSEVGQTGFRTSTPGTPPTLTTVEAVAGAVGINWATTDMLVSSTFRFHRVKAALIGVDGQYDPNFNPVIADVTPVPGSGATNNLPLQTACVTSLLSDFVSGRARRGRMYFPPLGASVNASGVWTPSQALNRSEAVATMLGAVETITGETVQIMSSIGAGFTRPVTLVATGARPDIQRSRARSVDESYQQYPMP